VGDIFRRLSQPRPAETISQAQILRPAQPGHVERKVLDWLVNRWREPVISARQLYTYTRSAQTREEAVALATNLEKAGWLVRLPTKRYDSKVWAIVRDPSHLSTPHANRTAELP
jgi:hypothetical protein